MTARLLFLLQMLAALPAVAAPGACDPVPGLEPVVRGSDVVLLGEMHGTVESPAFVGRMVCLALGAGRSVTVGLEMPLEEEPRVHAFLASPGSPADREALLAGAFWQAAYQDGRRSRAMLDLLDDLRRRSRGGAALHVLLLDSVAFAGGAERDRGMAGRLAAAIAKAPGDLVVVLTGNLHTRLRRGGPEDPILEPMGSVLRGAAPRLRIAALDVSYGGGSAWICATPDAASCGAKALTGKPGAVAAAGVDSFAAVDAAGYSGVYRVGSLTASPPAVQRPAPAP